MCQPSAMGGMQYLPGTIPYNKKRGQHEIQYYSSQKSYDDISNWSLILVQHSLPEKKNRPKFENFSLVIYTNGSKTDHGIGVYRTRSKIKLVTNLMDTCKVIEAELHAIKLCLWGLLNNSGSALFFNESLEIWHSHWGS